jgi:hypothetical protein
MRVTDRPTVLFCVGAAKAGTTWLFDQLSTHPDCHLRSVKELHYFTSVESGRFGYQIKVQRARAARLALRVEMEGQGGAAAQKLRDVTDWIAVLGQRRENLPAYLGYLSDGRGDRGLVADVTPAYGLLAEDSLRRMAGLAADVRFVFLMRDPVARLWSHVRMLARRAAGGAGYAATAMQMMDGILDGTPSGAVERGDYAGILTRLGRAVAPQRLLVQFQDEMMTVPGFARLCAFLGIRTTNADTARRVHEGVPLPLPEAQAARARAFLRPQYDFVRQNFGDLPDSWQQNMVGV